jgi:tape measure domain-containing protein
MSNTAQYIIEISTNGDRATVSRVDAVQRKLEATDRSAARLSGRVGGLGKAFQNLPGAGFFANHLVQLTAGIGVVSKLGMQAEKTATAFNVLVGSEAKAAKMLGQINEYADKTLWDRSSTQEAAKTMLGFGVSTESVVKDLKMLGDVAMGDKNKLQQLALVFGQISAAGKLQGQDLLQLINAGYNPLLDISALTGKSVAKLKDEMSKGLVTFDMVRAAFQRATSEGGKFNQMTAQIAQTTYGAWEQLKGKFLGTMLDIYEIIRPTILTVINGLTIALNEVGEAARWVSKNFQAVVAVLAPVTAAVVTYNLVTSISTKLTNGWTIATRAQYVALLLLEKAQKLVNIVMSANPIALIIAGIAALATAVAICWNKFAGFRAVILTVWETIKGFGQILKNYVLDRIQGIMTGVGKLGEAFSKLFKGDFSGAWDAAKGAASGLLGIDAKRNAAASAKQLVGGIGSTYNYTLANERAKDRAKQELKTPEAAGGVAETGGAGAAAPMAGAASSGKLASDIATGGTRNTSITINISKFFDDVNITTASSTDMRKLQDTILEGINRSLEIATSAAR